MTKINAMRKAVLLLSVCCALLAACGGKKDKNEETTAGFKENEFTRSFPSLNLKFQLSDSLLARTGKQDKPIAVTGKNYFPDSLVYAVFGKGAKPKFYPLGKAANGSEELYVVLKAVEGDKQAAFLLCYDGSLIYKDGLVFCESDNDPKTFHSASLDRSFNIIIRKETYHTREDISVVERALVYNAEGFFMDVMNNDPEKKLALVNPIDTLAAKGKFSGDYAAQGQNFISIRDGKDSGEFIFYYYMDKGEDCRNTIRDVARLTSKNTAVFKKDGDPCVFTFTFGNNQVTLKEEDGCGNYRGLNCTLNGSFSKKKKLNLGADTAKTTTPPAAKPKPKPAADPKKETKPPPPKKAPVKYDDVQ